MNIFRVFGEKIEALSEHNGFNPISEKLEAHYPEKSRCMLLAVCAPEEHEMAASDPKKIESATTKRFDLLTSVHSVCEKTDHYDRRTGFC